MNRLITNPIAALVVIFALTGSVPTAAQEVTVKVLEQWTQALSNWGRWGPKDEAGSLGH
jgi:hypothetical protein